MSSGFKQMKSQIDRLSEASLPVTLPVDAASSTRGVHSSMAKPPAATPPPTLGATRTHTTKSKTLIRGSTTTTCGGCQDGTCDGNGHDGDAPRKGGGSGSHGAGGGGKKPPGDPTDNRSTTSSTKAKAKPKPKAKAKREPPPPPSPHSSDKDDDEEDEEEEDEDEEFEQEDHLGDALGTAVPTKLRRAAVAGTTIFDFEPDGNCVTRKEAESLTLEKFTDIVSFRKRWTSLRRRVINKSGRKFLARDWFDQINDLENVTEAMLLKPGKVFEQYDGKLLDGLLADGMLPAELAYNIEFEEQRRYNARPRQPDLTGRLAARMVWEWYVVDATAKALFNINHLQELKYPGDAHMSQFLTDWLRILDDQDGVVDEKRREQIFYKKIKSSTKLKPYLEYYDRLDEDHEDHSYAYLIKSYTGYLKKTRRERHLAGLTGQEDHTHGDGWQTKGGKPLSRKALAIRHSQQCPHWLKPGGCREPETCKLGLRDEQLKGKGPAPTTKGQPPAGKGATKGAHDTKGGGKGEKGKEHKDFQPCDDGSKPTCNGEPLERGV